MLGGRFGYRRDVARLPSGQLLRLDAQQKPLLAGAHCIGGHHSFESHKYPMNQRREPALLIEVRSPVAQQGRFAFRRRWRQEPEIRR